MIEFSAGLEGRGQVEREICGSGDEEVPTLPLSVRDSTSREQQEIREKARRGPAVLLSGDQQAETEVQR